MICITLCYFQALSSKPVDDFLTVSCWVDTVLAEISLILLVSLVDGSAAREVAIVSQKPHGMRTTVNHLDRLIMPLLVARLLIGEIATSIRGEQLKHRSS